SAQVGADAERRSRPARLELGDERLGRRRGAEVMDRDVVAGVVQRRRDHGADALRGAGHECPARLAVAAPIRFRHACASLLAGWASKGTLSRAARGLAACQSPLVTLQHEPDFPVPDAAALAASAALAERIRAAIEAAGGWIDFARYMEL